MLKAGEHGAQGSETRAERRKLRRRGWLGRARRAPGRRPGLGPVFEDTWAVSWLTDSGQGW